MATLGSLGDRPLIPANHHGNSPFAAQEALDEIEREGQAQDEEVVDEPTEPVDDEPVEEPKEEVQEEEAVDPLILEAEHYGFSQEEAAEFGDRLPGVLAALDKQAAKLVRDREAKPETKEVEPAKVEKTEPAPDIFKIPDELKIELDPLDYDENQLKTINQIRDYNNELRKTLVAQQDVLKALAQAVVDTHQSISTVSTSTQSVQEAEFTKEMDGFIASLGNEYLDIYGKRPIGELNPNSPLVENRRKLAAEMKILEQVDKEAGRPPASIRSLANRAVRMLNAERSESVARKQVQQQINDQRRKAIARPSGRNAKPASPDERAEQAIRASLVSMGIGVDE